MILSTIRVGCCCVLSDKEVDMSNLVQNGDFEGGAWQETFDGEVYNEISAPEHWTVFWKEGGEVPHDPRNTQGYRRPECKVISKVRPFLDPPRIHEGEQAWQCFTFFGIHDAGLYQQVEGIEPGTRLRASAWTHAWSNNADNAHESDTSGGGQWNFTQYVGIDPTGGTDPWGETVVWSEPRNVYDVYEELPPVEVEAESETVTVFIRSVVMWPFKHCDVHWDDVRLEVVEPAEPGEPEEPSLEDLELVVEPEQPEVGEVFTVLAQRAAWIASVRLVFDGGEVYRTEPLVLEGEIKWRCITFTPGEYTVRALAGNTLLVDADFIVGPG
jgi:hypothetical protein